MTQVKTFLQEDTKELIHDGEKLQQWKDQVEELGLEGQESLASEDKSPIPFLYMKKPVETMFDILCPKKEKVEAFNKEPIPLEALGVIALAQREGYFAKIMIWYDDKDPDPIAVGYKEDSSRSDKYLLARWGDEDIPLGELRVHAKKKWKENAKIELDEKIAEAQENLRKLDNLADKKLNGDWVSL